MNINNKIQNIEEILPRLKSYISSLVIPTKLSDLTDDLGTNPTHTHSQYLTSHQSLSGYATETWVGQQGYLTGITYNDVVNALTYVPQQSEICVSWLLNSPITYYIWQHQSMLHTTKVATTSSTPTAGDTVYMIDSNGRIFYCNKL